jgi:hypothetical protein
LVGVSVGAGEDCVLEFGDEILESAESFEVELEHPISENAKPPANKSAVKLRKIELKCFILVLSFHNFNCLSNKCHYISLHFRLSLIDHQFRHGRRTTFAPCGS